MIIEMNAVKSRTGNGVLRRGVLALAVLLLALCFVGAVSAAEESAVARIGGATYTDVQDALNNSQSGDTVELLQNVTVATWYQYGDVPNWKVIPDNVIFDGKGYQLTVNSVSSLGNGDYLFRNQGYITIQNMKVVMKGGNGAFSLHDSVVKNVSITRSDGASSTGYGILTGSNVTIAECIFNGMAHAIYTNDSGTGTGIVVKNCIFNCERAMILRNDEIFTENTLKSVCTNGITVDTTATSTITENNFEAGSRLKLYEPREATAPVIKDNIISGSIVVDPSAQSVSIGENTITGDVDSKIANAVASIGDMKYTTLLEALNAAVAKIGPVTVEILANVQLSGEWIPPIVDGSIHALGVVTINGNNHYISGLDKPLIGSTWAGNSGLVINDLTIKDSTIIDDKDDTTEDVGVGAFCGYPSASTIITLQNCHLLNSTVEGGHWTGGLVGAADGYSGNDGPVFMELTIKGCSVIDSIITGKGSCGAVVGHATQDAWTKFIIEDTTITDNIITSTGTNPEKAGSVMGTIGVAGSEKEVNGESHTGGVYLSAYVRGNTVTSAGTPITTVYGRQGNDPGKLHITGGMYDPFPYKQYDDFVTSIELVKINGMWQKPQPQPPVPVISSSGDGNMNNAYRVLFETNGGSFIRPATDLSAGDKITAPANPVKDGYTFAGWYKDAACTQGWSFSDAIDGDMTLYAKWTGGSAAQQTTTETAAPTAQPTTKQTTAPVQTQSQGASATTAAPAATTAAGVSPTLTQAPAPVLGALLGLLAAGVLIRRRE